MPAVVIRGRRVPRVNREGVSLVGASCSEYSYLRSAIQREISVQARLAPIDSALVVGGRTAMC